MLGTVQERLGGLQTVHVADAGKDAQGRLRKGTCLLVGLVLEQDLAKLHQRKALAVHVARTVEDGAPLLTHLHGLEEHAGLQVQPHKRLQDLCHALIVGDLGKKSLGLSQSLRSLLVVAALNLDRGNGVHALAHLHLAADALTDRVGLVRLLGRLASIALGQVRAHQCLIGHGHRALLPELSEGGQCFLAILEALHGLRHLRVDA
mmetsp:Transcript_7930/g.25225  ORF Transcript_7930/g.25225 Transcript_7930/m.25225 type:complete len:205 (+) Transcript_7930:255-869(+)